MREVMVVNIFGSGVAGLSIHASTHTPPIVDFWMERKNDYHTHMWILFFSPRVDKHPRTANLRPSCCCAPTDKNRAVLPHAGPPLSVPFLAGSDCLPTHRYSSVWGTHSEMRDVLLHPHLTVKGHSHFLLSHRLFGSFLPAVSCAHW